MAILRCGELTPLRALLPASKGLGPRDDIVSFDRRRQKGCLTKPVLVYLLAGTALQGYNRTHNWTVSFVFPTVRLSSARSRKFGSRAEVVPRDPLA